MNVEWQQLDEIKAWDYECVGSYADKFREAEHAGKTIHFGRIFPLCNIKHSEVPDFFHR